MSKHLKHVLESLAAMAAAGAPTVAADPSFRHYVERHPGLDAIYPAAVALLIACYRAFVEKRQAAASVPPASSAPPATAQG